MTWEPAKFLIAWFDGPCARSGYVYRGLGIFKVMDGSPKGRRKPRWALTHLGSGHRLCLITGDVATAFPIASEIAELGDWTFDGLDGWKNQFPDAPQRLTEVIAAHAKIVSSGPQGSNDHDAARQIALARS